MAKPGRPEKTIIEVSQRYGIGVDSLGYTIEEFSPSQGWRPIKWPSSLPDAAATLVELTARGRVVEMLGAGVSRLSEVTAKRILGEVEADARRIYESIHRATAGECDSVVP